jgi:hypothetical protein
MVVLQFLNPNVNGTIEPTIVDDDEEFIFGAVTSNEATLLLKNELSLIHHLLVKPKDIILPLIWWKTHEPNFPTFLLWLDRFLGFLGPILKLKEFSMLLEC